jgi:hypothetical protein
VREFRSFVRLGWLLACASLCAIAACGVGCGVAFTAGTHDVAQQPELLERDISAHNEEEVLEEGRAGRVPVFGVSFVVGGAALDAGVLPKPPIPVVVVP